MSRAEQGFSLLELAIVLLIVGLLAGGIIFSSNLIAAAELRQVGDEMRQFTAQVHIFEQKYEALPGDMDNATDYWGAAAVPASCLYTQGTGTQTCNGNNNRMIESNGETVRAWQHLANAGLVEGSYTGVPGAYGDYHLIAGVNAPKAPRTNVTYNFAFYTNMTDAAPHFHLFNGKYGNILEAYLAGGEWPEPAFTPEEAQNIDAKFDDGRATTGIIVGSKQNSSWGTGCTTSDDEETAEYDLMNEKRTCRITYITGF